MRITKRDGTKEKFDIDKIKQVVARASEGFDVNPIELEARMSNVFRDGITTREIQHNLINQALTLTSVQAPDWRYVSGRLLMMNYWKEVELTRGYLYRKDLSQYVKAMIERGYYSTLITDIYSDQDLDEAGNWINEKLDLDYDYAGANMMLHRYLIEDELPQEAFMVISLLLASVEKAEDRMDHAKTIYDLLSQRKLSLATPILINLRRPEGSLSSCFITSMGDDLDSIFDAVTQVARISKNGGGVGVNLSKIRGKGSWVKRTKNASGGVLPWIKIVNDTAVAVNQMGKRCVDPESYVEIIREEY